MTFKIMRKICCLESSSTPDESQSAWNWSLFIFYQVQTQHSWAPANFRPVTFFKFHEEADFLSQQELAAIHTAKNTDNLFNDHDTSVWPASKLSEPYGQSMENCQNKAGREPAGWAMQKSSRLLLKTTWVSFTPQTDHLHATLDWCSWIMKGCCFLIFPFWNNFLIGVLRNWI